MRKWLWTSIIVFMVVLLGGAAHQFIAYGRENKANINPDVVIIGTELEGLYLAQRAKQEGLRPLILEPSGAVGGQLLQGEMLYLDGIYDAEGKSLMQGGFKDLFHEYTEGRVRKLAQFEKVVQGLTKQIPLEKNITLGEVKVDNGKVTSLTYIKKNGNRRTVAPLYVVDNTDSAVLVNKLGVPPLPGLEALYGSTQKEYMSATYMMKFKGVDWERFYSEFWAKEKLERTALYGPETYVDGNLAYGFPPIVAEYQLRNKDMLNLRGLNILNQKNGEILINALQVYDVDPSRPETVEKGMRLAKEELPFIRDHLKSHLVGFENIEIAGEPKYLYIREYNHYPTDYVMQASDLLSGRMFRDNVSIGGYFLDIQGSRSNREGLAIGRPDRYGLPLRSYMLQDYENVFVVGKLVGSTAVAYGSTRIQPNGVLAGESIGVLMGRNKGKSLKKLSELDMQQFQVYMNTKYGINLNQTEGKNKITGLTAQDIEDLNKGLITLLPDNVQARHLPFLRVFVGDKEIGYKGLKPLIIDGSTWVPMEETFQVLGARQVRYEMDKKIVYYLLPNATVESKMMNAPVHILNNHVLMGLQAVMDVFQMKANWEQEFRIVRLVKR
jgi:hypothetical protein